MLIKRFFTLIFLASLFHGCGTGYGPASPTNEQIQDTTVNDINILKVANPHLTVARGDIIYKIEGKEYDLYKSTDGGNTFELILTSADDLTQSNAHSLYLTSEGTLLWSYTTHSFEENTLNIKTFRSTDQGQTFDNSTTTIPDCVYEQTAIVLSSATSKSSLDHDDAHNGQVCDVFAMDWISPGSGYPLYLVLGFENERSLQFLTSNDEGLTFFELQQIGGIDSYYDYASLEAAMISATMSLDNFFISAAYADGFLRSSNNQTDFEVINLPNTDQDTRITKNHLIYKNNKLYNLYQKSPYESYILSYYLVKSTDEGNTLSEPSFSASVDYSTLRWGYEDFDVYEDNMYILWSRQKTSGDDYNGAMYLAQSSDGGETFGEIERISDYGLTDIWGDLYIDYQGNVFVFWTDSSMNSER